MGIEALSSFRLDPLSLDSRMESPSNGQSQDLISPTMAKVDPLAIQDPTGNRVIKRVIYPNSLDLLGP